MSNIAIRVENLSKLYKIGARRNRHDTLRDHLAHGFKSLFSRNGRSSSLAYQPSTLSGQQSAVSGHPSSVDGRSDTIWALKDVSFDIKHGEVLGFIGRNGAGKSTLLKILSRITEPTSGRAEIYGRVASLLEVGTGFHPELTGRENIYLNGAILGMKKTEINRKFDEIVAFSGVEKFIDAPIKHYSSGMMVRLAFSVAAHLEPEILIIDEVLAVGDAEFQKKCLGKMDDVAKQGRTVFFVSHNMAAIRKLCQRVIMLNGGKLILDGPVEKVIDTYLEPDLTLPSQRIWKASESPGGEKVRLNAVRVCDVSGNNIEKINVHQAVGIELEYTILKGDNWPAAIVHFFTPEGLHLFGSHDLRYKPSGSLKSTPCVVREICWIPGNLLTEGRIIVSVAIGKFSPIFINYAVAPEVVAFEIIDSSDVSSAVGPNTGKWPGVVRPLLNWDHHVLS